MKMEELVENRVYDFNKKTVVYIGHSSIRRNYAEFMCPNHTNDAMEVWSILLDNLEVSKEKIMLKDTRNKSVRYYWKDSDEQKFLELEAKFNAGILI